MKQMFPSDVCRMALMQPLQKLFPQQGVTVASTISSLQIGHRRLLGRMCVSCSLVFALFRGFSTFSWEGEGLAFRLEPISGSRCVVVFLSSTVLRSLVSNKGGEICAGWEDVDRSRGDTLSVRTWLRITQESWCIRDSPFVYSAEYQDKEAYNRNSYWNADLAIRI